MGIRETVRRRFFGFSPLKRALLLAVFVVIVLSLLLGIGAIVRARLARWSFLPSETALLEQKAKAEERARIAEGKAVIAEELLKAKQQKILELTRQALQAEAALDRARAETATVRKRYEQIRNNSPAADPVRPVPSADDLCADLAAAGFRCR